ncbi:MAG TPA: translation elongation factor 4 [Dehalococcoidia bacterium]|nr:translation elongation factor 4 [Dehalococcoidia bacterium]
MQLERIRNFSIIAHIDHGKSTLADRLLERTGTIGPREAAAQFLDSMELEREKGVTIKAKAVRMTYRAKDGLDYELNLIDTPGHVDFAYEVSRALVACEGALLVVDAAQGVQAQTLANLYAAMENDLTIVPVINKIDLPNAEPERVAEELERIVGFAREEMIYASAKEGIGTEDVLEAVVRRVPPPKGAPDAPLRALIFDSKYDSYKGVIAYVRVVDGRIPPGQPLRLMSNDIRIEPVELGVFSPGFQPVNGLDCGEVGYVATGLKSVREARVGDTITLDARPATEPLPGYRPAKSMVFAGLYPAQANDYNVLRDALEKLRLSDAALTFEPESSIALGFGFRCGFLGLFHMEIVQERLEREYGLTLIFTAPSVEYQITKTDGTEMVLDNPADLPPPNEIAEIREPWVDISVVLPERFVGAVMELTTARRGVFKRMEYLEASGTATGAGRAAEMRVLLEYSVPLAEILTDYYDQLKSRTQGYASLDYTLAGYKPAKLVKLDVLVNGQPVDALTIIVHPEEAQAKGRELVEKLRRLIPRQLFDVPIQAAIGGRIIARETVRAMRKNVLAKCYGGDVTRKRKLLEKQAEGKKRMRRVGNVEIPQEAFMAVLSLER